MKLISKGNEARSTNCGGGSEVFTVIRYEVESIDIGTTKPNYLGYKHRNYTFTASDTGRVIEILSQCSGYNCFYFVSE